MGEIKDKSMDSGTGFWGSRPSGMLLSSRILLVSKGGAGEETDGEGEEEGEAVEGEGEVVAGGVVVLARVPEEKVPCDLW